MSFSKAKRFSYSTPPLNLENRRFSSEFGKNEKNQTVAFVERRRTIGHFRVATDEDKRNPKRGEERLQTYFKNFLSPENTPMTSTPVKKKDVRYGKNRERHLENLANKTKMNPKLNETYSVNLFNRKQPSARKNQDENVSISDTLSSFDSFYSCNIIKSGVRNNKRLETKDSGIEEYEEEILTRVVAETENVVNSSRSKFKKVSEAKFLKFRRETENKLKLFVEELNKSSQILLAEVQNECDGILEDLNRNLIEVVKKVTDKEEISKNFKNMNNCSEQLTESRKYIKFLENSYKELLLETDNKISEQSCLIQILKDEVDSSSLGGMLQNILSKQNNS